ncbi:MAG: ATP-dependent 6-phosphofructokinase [Actinomycetota bacterium]|nr:MAG: ATP-dependent 6-phosphofructokinase [Actinomycetota bacterium]
MQYDGIELDVQTLGDCTLDSPLSGMLETWRANEHYVGEDDRVLLDDVVGTAAARGVPIEAMPSFEAGGPRRRVFFDGPATSVGIVTCGGLCPGLNDVIRGLVQELTQHYGVRRILGFRNGYQGLAPSYGHLPLELTPQSVTGIIEHGGTILGTSRGSQRADEVVDTLQRLAIDILFVVGGDGTLRGAQRIAEEISARGARIAVVGIPKTIDNDIPYIDHSFGFRTAYSQATETIRAAYVEARSAPGGVGLVKLMGRHSGFIACYAALAKNDADYVLIPEVPFALEGDGGFLDHLLRRVADRGHAVVVVAEGAGQDHVPGAGYDASGNARLGDVGALLKRRIAEHFRYFNAELNLRYFDPSYSIRSVPAGPYDAVYCVRLAHAAVHAAMAGRTCVVVGRWHGRMVHLPIPLAVSKRNQVDPHGDLWMAVLESTGQPRSFP